METDVASFMRLPENYLLFYRIVLNIGKLSTGCLFPSDSIQRDLNHIFYNNSISPSCLIRQIAYTGHFLC